MSGMIPRPIARPVPFNVVAPLALYVEVTGDFTGWLKHGIRLRRHGNGEWHDHPESTRRICNSYGTENCVLKVN